MKCKCCGTELPDAPEWVKLNENVEIESKIHDMGIAFKDIKIPKGCRLLTVQEIIELANNEKLRKLIFSTHTGIFIKQYYKQNEKEYCASAWLGCNNSFFSLNSNDYLGGDGASRGVLFAGNVRKETEE